MASPGASPRYLLLLARGTAHHEFDSEHFVTWRARAPVDEIEHALGGAATELAHGLANGSETERVSNRVIVKADNGKFTGDVHAPLASDLEYAKRHFVGQTEYGARPLGRRHVEQRVGSKHTTLDGILTDQLDGCAKPGISDRPAETTKAEFRHRRETGTRVRASNDAESSVSEFDQVASRHRAAECIIDSERVLSIDTLTDNDDRAFGPRTLPGRSEEGIDDNNPVDPLIQVGVSGDQISTAIRCTQRTYQQVVIGRLENIFKPGRDLIYIPSREMRRDQTHRLGATGSQSRGVGIGDVAEHGGGITHPLTNFRTHMRKVPQGPTHRRFGNTGAFRDIGNRRRAGGYPDRPKARVRKQFHSQHCTAQTARPHIKRKNASANRRLVGGCGDGWSVVASKGAAPCCGSSILDG